MRMALPGVALTLIAALISMTPGWLHLPVKARGFA
jgi:hypothetical protein